MGGIALLVWLASYSLITLINSSIVTRRRDGDQFETKSCINCAKYAAKCSQNDTKCCKRCRCKNEMTFYHKNISQTCVNPNGVEGCEYFFRQSQRNYIYKHESKVRRFHSFDLKGYDGIIDIGVIKHERYKIHSKDCAVEKQQYWNLTKWDSLPTIGKKKANFTIPRSRGQRTVKVRFPSRNTSVYQGLLIKLEIQCDGVDKSSHPCIMFKTLGKKRYIVSTEKVTVKPPISGKYNKENWFVIIGITVGLLLVIIVAIVCILYCRRKKRKGEHRRYRNDTLSDEGLLMRGETKPSASCGNATKRDPNYEYPDLNLELATIGKDSDSKNNIYAEIVTPEAPVYSAMENVIARPTGVSEVVGVPDYRPTRSPVSPQAGTSSTAGTYSALDTSSMGDSNAYQTLLDSNDTESEVLPKAPSSPKYAELLPDMPKKDENGGEVQI